METFTESNTVEQMILGVGAKSSAGSRIGGKINA